ncbi:MAG: glycosyltransferase family 2 protein [bacterium]
MPAVSVILTTYNRSSFLAEALESILGQDYKDFELIVVDDRSTDTTIQVIRPYLHRLTYTSHTSNRGVSAARNTGLIHASGQFICFLDSDDLWKKKKLSSQIRFLETHPGYQICYTNEIWLRNGQWLNQGLKHKKFSGYIFEKLLPLCIISPSSVMISRQVFAQTGYFDESFPACEDYDLWLRIGCRFPIGYLEDRLIVKRGGHEDQLSQKFIGLDKLRIKALLKILESGNLNSQQKETAWETLKEKCTIYGRGCLKHHKEPEGLFFLSLVEHIETCGQINDFQRFLTSPYFSSLVTRRYQET